MSSLYENYFADRGASSASDALHGLPTYLLSSLPIDLQARILDIGCGQGMALRALKELGYDNASGVDVSADTVEACHARGLNVARIDSITDLIPEASEKFDFILMTHVLEHIPKSQIIPILQHIRTRLLAEAGTYYVAVPNAQSNTGCYWAYEDFTHETLFTAGSLYFVLKKAGFEQIAFLDADGMAQGAKWKRPFRKLLLALYRRKIDFWNKVTGSAYHAPSPRIFTFELKACAKARV